jgi:uroporphyrinogen decarboxylase
VKPDNASQGKTGQELGWGKLLRVLDGEAVWPPPLWMMRQAGRYLPEYRALRATAPDFLRFCYTPDMAAEATLQPIRRFGFDAAIIFSDILVVPDALGRAVHFVAGEGPRLEPIESIAAIDQLPEAADWSRLAPTVEAIGQVRQALDPSTALLGFCGAPWTVATYMIAGRGTPDQAPARLFAYREPEAFAKLIERIVIVSAEYLVAQLRAGADAVQIFDSWAGVLPPPAFERWCLAPIERLIALVRASEPDARIIGFPRGASVAGLQAAADRWSPAALSLDTTADRADIRLALGSSPALQGNLDPLALLAGGEAQDTATARLLAAGRGNRFIFNLGHGILPPTPIEHVERLVAQVRSA